MTKKLHFFRDKQAIIVQGPKSEIFQGQTNSNCPRPNNQQMPRDKQSVIVKGQQVIS